MLPITRVELSSITNKIRPHVYHLSHRQFGFLNHRPVDFEYSTLIKLFKEHLRSLQVKFCSCFYTMKYAVIFSLVFLAAVIVMAKVPFKMNNRGGGKKPDFNPVISSDAGKCYLCVILWAALCPMNVSTFVYNRSH
ncbi:hypothetical protein ACROYT_G007687 [Oculina patagonica]